MDAHAQGVPQLHIQTCTNSIMYINVHDIVPATNNDLHVHVLELETRARHVNYMYMYIV